MRITARLPDKIITFALKNIPNMEVFSQIENYAALPSAVCVGVFDGLHLGHRALLSQLKAEAEKRGLLSVVVTFDPHPRIALSKGNDRVGLLTTQEERLELLREMGIDRVVVIPFTREFSDLTARQFLREWVAGKFMARFMLMGYNHHFGSDDVKPEDYISLAASEGIEAKRGEAFSLAGGVKVSSSEVRKALSDGDVTHAALLLGRDYDFRGVVSHGDALGRAIGFRTANVTASDFSKLIPADGVYSGLVCWEGQTPLRSVINVGTRPTVGGNDRRVEAHIMNFDSDIYGQHVTVSFHERLRDEMRFDDLESLACQIKDDMRKAAISFENR